MLSLLYIQSVLVQILGCYSEVYTIYNFDMLHRFIDTKPYLQR